MSKNVQKNVNNLAPGPIQKQQSSITVFKGRRKKKLPVGSHCSGVGGGWEVSPDFLTETFSAVKVGLANSRRF